MTLYVVTNYELAQLGQMRQVIMATDLAVTLTLAAQLDRPTQTPRYIRRRGVPMLCGFTFQWHPLLWIPQTEPGPSTRHTFSLPCFDASRSYWITVSDQPTLNKPAASIPPMQVSCQGLNPPVASLTVASVAQSLRPAVSATVVTWDTLVENTPNWPKALPSALMQPPFPGVVSGSVSVALQTNGTGTATVQVENIVTGEVYAQATNTDWPGTNIITFNFQAAFSTLIQPWTVRVINNFTNLARVNPSGGPDSAWALALY